MISLLYLLVPLIAFLYASVGFGGATGYLAVMSIFGMAPQEMANSALVLNILVAGISFTSFFNAGHFRHDLLIPFLITSLPAAFFGGSLPINDTTYKVLLYLALTFVAVRLLFFSRPQEDTHPLRPVPFIWALVIGLAIGFLSGMVGIGGGIFLSPIIIFTRWGSPKQAASTAAAFIVLNSISGLAGRVIAGTFLPSQFSLSLIPFGVAGALVGSILGARRLSGVHIRHTLGIVMTLAVTNFWLRVWR